MEKAHIIAAITPYMVPVALAGVAVYVAYAVGVGASSSEPQPDINAAKAFKIGSFARNLTAHEASNYFSHAGYA
jgi:hypothetical protein